MVEIIVKTNMHVQLKLFRLLLDIHIYNNNFWTCTNSTIFPSIISVANTNMIYSRILFAELLFFEPLLPLEQIRAPRSFIPHLFALERHP